MRGYAMVQTKDLEKIDDFMARGETVEEIRAKMEAWLRAFDVGMEFSYSIYKPLADAACDSRRGMVADLIREEATR